MMTLDKVQWTGALLLALAVPLSAQATPPPSVSTPSAAAPPPAAPATPGPVRYAAADFAEKTMLGQLNLSPDGHFISFSSTDSGQVSLVVMETDSRKVVHRLAMPAKNALEWYRWAGNNRVLISLSQRGSIFDVEVRFTRLFVYDLQTRQMSLVGKSGQGINGDELLYVDPAGQFVLLAMQRDIYDWPAVWRFPLDGTAQKTGKVVQPGRKGVVSWFADTKGAVRLGLEVNSFYNIKVWYRSTGQEDFRTVAKLDQDSKDADFWKVLAIIGDSDDGYVLKPDDTGRVILRHFNFATQQAGKEVFSIPGWDVERALLDDEYNLIGATYTDDREHLLWLEPVKQAQQARIAKALKGTDAAIISWSQDNARMILWTGHENDPGAYYIFNAQTNGLDLFYAMKPRLDPAHLASPRAVTYTARDGNPIHAYLTLPLGRTAKALPLVVLPHGGPYGVRDALSYDTEVQFLANRGYAVLQPNFRGSGGYGNAFDKLGRGQIGRRMQDDLDDGMDWLVLQGIADPARVCVVGSSYGGYAALWAVIRNPERYRCAASFAGVTDWNGQLRYDRSFLSREDSRDWRKQVAGEDDGFDLDLVSPAAQVARLTRPVLLAHGQDDGRVPFTQFKTMQGAAAKAGVPLDELVFPDEGHGFDKAEDQAKWLETLGDFLAKHNPAD